MKWYWWIWSGLCFSCECENFVRWRIFFIWLEASIEWSRPRLDFSRKMLSCYNHQYHFMRHSMKVPYLKGDKVCALHGFWLKDFLPGLFSTQIHSTRFYYVFIMFTIWQKNLHEHLHLLWYIIFNMRVLLHWFIPRYLLIVFILNFLHIYMC